MTQSVLAYLILYFSTVGQPAHLASNQTTVKGTTKAERVKYILTADKRVQSKGYAANGRLYRGTELKSREKHVEVLPGHRHRKNYHFGTDYLIGAIRRASARVAKQFKGAVLQVGNLSKKNGRQISFSVSHQSGRDADIVFYVRDMKGNVGRMRKLASFGDDGLSRRYYPRMRFDVPRNWALIEALLSDKQVQIQWIFISTGLRKLLLDYAKKQRRPARILKLAESVLRQPMLSGNHDDHFHLRVYCSLEDRFGGCVDYGTIWPWTDRFQKRVDQRARLLWGLAEKGSRRQRLKALELLAGMRGRVVAPQVVKLLDDPDRMVVLAAASALKKIATVELIPDLVNAFTSPRRHKVARILVNILGRLRHPSSLPFLYRLANGKIKHKVPDKLLTNFTRRVIELIGQIPSKRSVPVLIGLLSHKWRGVRMQSALSLTMITNHSFGFSWYRRVSERKLKSWIGRWQKWWQDHQALPRLQLVMQGFKRVGLKWNPKKSPKRIPRLIQAIFWHKPHFSINAQFVLNELSGRKVNPYGWQSKKKCYRYWKVWWENNYDRVELGKGKI